MYKRQLPESGEVTPLGDQGSYAQHRDRQEQTVLPIALIDFEPVGDGQPGGAESGVAGSDGTGDDTPVSYTHLDVYKRQAGGICSISRWAPGSQPVYRVA